MMLSFVSFVIFQILLQISIRFVIKACISCAVASKVMRFQILPMLHN